MNAEIMELSIDFSSVAKGDRTKLWCGKMGKKGPNDAENVSASAANEVEAESLQAVGKTVELEVGKL